MKEIESDEPQTWIEIIQDNNYALLFTVITCIALAPNTYYMYYSLSVIAPYFREAQAALVACIICGSILYYTARKNLHYARIFAWFEFFVSSCYYMSSLIFDVPGKNGPVWNWHIIPAEAFAYMLPWSVRGYAESIDFTIRKAAKKVFETVIEKPIEIIKQAIAEPIEEPALPVNDRPLNELTTKEIIEIIENDEIESAFSKGALGANVK